MVEKADGKALGRAIRLLPIWEEKIGDLIPVIDAFAFMLVRGPEVVDYINRPRTVGDVHYEHELCSLDAFGGIWIDGRLGGVSVY